MIDGKPQGESGIAAAPERGRPALGKYPMASETLVSGNSASEAEAQHPNGAERNSAPINCCLSPCAKRQPRVGERPRPPLQSLSPRGGA